MISMLKSKGVNFILAMSLLTMLSGCQFWYWLKPYEPAETQTLYIVSDLQPLQNLNTKQWAQIGQKLEQLTFEDPNAIVIYLGNHRARSPLSDYFGLVPLWQGLAQWQQRFPLIAVPGQNDLINQHQCLPDLLELYNSHQLQWLSSDISAANWNALQSCELAEREVLYPNILQNEQNNRLKDSFGIYSVLPQSYRQQPFKSNINSLENAKDIQMTFKRSGVVWNIGLGPINEPEKWFTSLDDLAPNLHISSGLELSLEQMSQNSWYLEIPPALITEVTLTKRGDNISQVNTKLILIPFSLKQHSQDKALLSQWLQEYQLQRCQPYNNDHCLNNSLSYFEQPLYPNWQALEHADFSLTNGVLDWANNSLHVRQTNNVAKPDKTPIILALSSRWWGDGKTEFGNDFNRHHLDTLLPNEPEMTSAQLTGIELKQVFQELLDNGIAINWSGIYLQYKGGKADEFRLPNGQEVFDNSRYTYTASNDLFGVSPWQHCPSKTLCLLDEQRTENAAKLRKLIEVGAENQLDKSNNWSCDARLLGKNSTCDESLFPALRTSDPNEHKLGEQLNEYYKKITDKDK